MKNYNKPKIEFIELQIAENIAAIVPKTVYRSEGSSSGMVADSDVGVTDEKNFGESSII